MIDLCQHLGLNDLGLDEIPHYRHNRFPGIHHRSFGKGVHIAGEAKVRQIREESFIEEFQAP